MMEFRISDSFTGSLAKLTSDEQKTVKTTAFDLQINPENPGHSFHKLDRAQDKNFWSVRVNLDIRMIVHRSKSSLLLCYVGHHDDAYKWAEKRKLETHPKTGAAQLVEIRERVEEIRIPYYVNVEQEKPEKPLIFANFSDEDLLIYGVPSEWLADIKLANEDSILDIADHLPSEASEALLELAVGGTPQPQVFERAIPESNPFNHPDALRRFRVMSNMDELEQALDSPWERWSIFLHPAQSELVERDYNGPARVAGSAGTGKTIVALHRAVYLAKHDPDARVLLTTFSDSLANALHYKLTHLIGNQPRLGERLEVKSMNAIGLRLYKASGGKHVLASDEQIRTVIDEKLSHSPGMKFSVAFILAEWEQVVDAWQLTSWKSLGIDVRGRSKTLRVNYRTSHQIRAQADRLLGPTVSDVDGNIDDRTGTVSVFNGPSPMIETFDSIDEEIAFVTDWLKKLVEEGFQPHEIGVFIRSTNEMDRALKVLNNAGIPFKVLDKDIRLSLGSAALSTMHFAKGLEFRAVVVMACDDEIVPSQQRIESVTDNADLQEVYETERHLLYVACTRARDRLLVTSGNMASEFLDDLVVSGSKA